MIGSVELETLRGLDRHAAFLIYIQSRWLDQRDERAKRFNVLQFYQLKFTGVRLEYPSERWQFAWDFHR